VKRNILDDPVALVEDPEDSHALGHRGDIGLSRARRRSLLGRGLVHLLSAAVARGERQDDQQGGCGPHAYSGIHGS
jgi:hypothetical protein